MEAMRADVVTSGPKAAVAPPQNFPSDSFPLYFIVHEFSNHNFYFYFTAPAAAENTIFHFFRGLCNPNI
jgi:hypothetical protein